MNEELPQGETKRGKIIALAPETISAMQKMRSEGKTIKFICDFFHVSPGTVSKYCPAPKEEPLIEDIPKSLEDLDEKANEEAVREYAKETVRGVKKTAAQDIQAGKLIQKYLAGLESRGIKLDLSKVKTPEEFLRIIKATYGDDVQMNGKAIVEQWVESQLSDKLNKTDASGGSTGGISFADIKEILLMQLLTKVVSGDNSMDNGSAPWQSALSEMREENSKLRQEMRDIMLEKRFQSLEDKQLDVVANLTNQLQVIQNKIVELKSLPNPTSEQKTALGELSTAVSELNRIKSSLISLGLVQATPGTPMQTQSPDIPEAFKNPDGSLNTAAYITTKLVDGVRTGIDAWSKKAPAYKPVCETPFTFDDYELYYNTLLQKPSLSAEEQAWIAGYLPYRSQHMPASQPVYVGHEANPSAEEPASPNPVDSMQADSNAPEPSFSETETAEPKSLIDRLKDQEEKRAAVLADIGI